MPRRRQDEGQRGTALVEFALLLPLLALVCLGTVDLGRAFKTVNEVRNAAREGAAFAQRHPSRLAGAACTDAGSAQWHARNEGGPTGQDFGMVVTTPAGTFDSADSGCGPFAAGATSGENLTVTVSTTFKLLTPLLEAVTGSPTIRSSVTVRVL